MLNKIRTLAKQALNSMRNTTGFKYLNIKRTQPESRQELHLEAKIDMTAFEFDMTESSVLEEFTLSRPEVRRISNSLLGSSPLLARFDRHRGSLRLDTDSYRLVIATDDADSAEQIVAMTKLADCQALLIGEGVKTRLVVSSTEFTYGIYPRSIKYEEKEA